LQIAELLNSTRAALNRQGFAADMRSIAAATVADFIAASNLAGDSGSVRAIACNPKVGRSVRDCLRSLLLSTNNTPGTEGYRVKLRHIGHSMNMIFNPATLSVTLKFSDSRSARVLMLDEGPETTNRLTRRINLYGDDVEMPSVQDMHRRIARNP
jgi:hypothetical protein